MARRILISLLLVILVVLNLAGVSALAQSEVRVALREANLSNFPTLALPVTVVNSSGVPVLDLTDANFEILEDGKPLTIDSATAQINSGASIAVALVLDLSNSAQIEEVKSATNQFLDTLENRGSNVRVAVIGFNDPLDFADIDPVKEIGFTSDLNAVRSVVNALPKGGASAVYEAIYKGVLITADEVADYRAVIVMTDGYDTASRPEIAQGDKPTEAAKERDIPVFTIGVYVPGMGSNPNYLNVVARETGGRYRELVDFGQLDDLFEDVVLQLQTEYLLTSRTTLSPDGKGHVFTVRATTTEGAGETTRSITYPEPPPIPQILKLQREVNGELQDLEAQASLKGRVLVVPQITAQNPLERVEYYVDGILANTVFVQQQPAGKESYTLWEWHWNTRSLEAGVHLLEILAYDEAGNISERFSMELQTEGGLNINPLLIVAIVAAVVLLVVVLFFILKQSKPRVVSSGPIESDTLVNVSSWPTGSAPQTLPLGGPNSGASMPGPTMNSAPPPPISTTTATQVSSRGGPAHAAPQSMTETISMRREPEAMAWLIGKNGSVQGREFRLHTVTNIGRLGNNDIVLDDPTVSRSHAKVRLDGETFSITDLGAANTTLVNGEEVTRCVLKDNDRVEIGNNVLIFKQIKSE